MAHILVVDDDKDLCALLKTALERDGHQVSAHLARPEGGRGRLPLGGLHPAGCDDAGGGWVCPLPPHPRAGGLSHPLPHGQDRGGRCAHRLGVGGDDYLTKPFRVAELRARVAAHLRREERVPHARLRRGGLEFDLAERAVYWQDAPLRLTKGEYAICEYLAMHPGQTFSKEQLYEAAFGYDGAADASAVTEHIKNIRAKLRPAGESPIETVWGVGYKWKNG